MTPPMKIVYLSLCLVDLWEKHFRYQNTSTDCYLESRYKLFDHTKIKPQQLDPSPDFGNRKHEKIAKHWISHFQTQLWRFSSSNGHKSGRLIWSNLWNRSIITHFTMISVHHLDWPQYTNFKQLFLQNSLSLCMCDIYTLGKGMTRSKSRSKSIPSSRS